MPAKIYISYRRDDDPAAAARVHDGLAASFGQSNLFIDIDKLRAGQRFEDEVAKALAACDVLIAIIGHRWMKLLKAKSVSGERDYVREEIASALERKIVIVPVRVGLKDHLPPLPRTRDLPEDIGELVLHQKHDVTHEQFGRDIAELSEAIVGVRGRLAKTVKLFLTAFLIICGTAAALFAISFTLASLLGNSAPIQLASSFAALPLLVFPKVLEALEQREGRDNFAAGNQNSIYDFSGFQIAWPLMALYGCFILISVDIVTVLPVTFIDDYIVHNFSDIGKPVRSAYQLGVTLSTNWLATTLSAYLVGRWIGARCSSKGMIAVLLAIIIAAASGVAFDLLFPNPEELAPEAVLDLYRFPFLMCAGLIGYWRGRKYRLSKYLHYLLDVLPADTRDTVIDLAFEEAQKVGSPKGLPAG
jgi:hypothetical protein